MRKFLLLVITLCLAGCVVSPSGGKQLSESGKVALQEVSNIAVRRYLAEHPGRQGEIIMNVRHVAAGLQSFTSVTTVSGLRIQVEAELQKISLSPADRQDAESLLNIFEALLRDQIGSDAIDSKALVKVNDFLKMIVAALPAL